MKSRMLQVVLAGFVLMLGIATNSLAQETAAPDSAGQTKPDAVQPQLDPSWLKDNQELITLVNDKKSDEAIEKAEKMITYLETHHLLESQEAATTYNNLGMAHLIKGQFDKANTYLLKALQLRSKLFGKTSLEVATVWLNLSQLYKMQAQYIFQLHQKDVPKENVEPAEKQEKPAKKDKKRKKDKSE